MTMRARGDGECKGTGRRENKNEEEWKGLLARAENFFVGLTAQLLRCSERRRERYVRERLYWSECETRGSSSRLYKCDYFEWKLYTGAALK